MRILRVSLRDYRGTGDRTVEPSPTGVTIVEGPNEVGKSSIPEAIDHLFDDLDSSARRELQAVRPVDRDVGPEVAIEVETGPYAFSYRKRFLRQPITELQVHRPRPEQLTGRAAHDRVQAILHETVDMALWKALRVSQGDLVGQAKLATTPSLAQSLDRAAGEAPAGDEERSLFDAAHAEYLRFWTETGRRRQEEVALERSIETSSGRVAALESAIGAIEADVESSLDLRSDSRRLSEVRAGLRGRVEEAQRRVDALVALEAGVAAAEARHEVARMSAEVARQTAEARTAALVALRTATEGRERLGTLATDDGTRLEAARATLATADESLASARAERDEARTCLDAAEGRLGRAREAAELANLEDRYARGRAANVAMTAAAADAALPVTSGLLADIREAHRAVELARVRVEAARPHVRIGAVAALDGSLDGLALRLAPGEVAERSVDGELRLDLPGVASVEVRAGAGGEAQAAELARAEARLEALLRPAGVGDLAEAERTHARREDAARTVAEQRRIREGVLQGVTPKAMGERIMALRERLAADVPPDPTDGDTPPDPEATRRRLADAETALQAAERARDAARAELHATELAASGRAADARRLDEDIDRRVATLDAQRATTPDDEVAARAGSAETAERAAAAELAATRQELAGTGLEDARRELADAARALEQVEVEIRLVQDRLLEVTTRLRDHGEDGLAEDLAEEQSTRDHLQAELRRLRAQAAARRLLFDTLREERDRAQRSYVGPLRREIERLGRMVFGEGFSVEVDESTLAVASRTQDGRTIPFRSLSVGAQEQIAIIGRLACATIVAPDGGVPVILDDALGNSDPARLAAMGEVLAAAGEQSQIIVLTCQPERYAHVRAARVIRL